MYLGNISLFFEATIAVGEWSWINAAFLIPTSRSFSFFERIVVYSVHRPRKIRDVDMTYCHFVDVSEAFLSRKKNLEAEEELDSKKKKREKKKAGKELRQI